MSDPNAFPSHPSFDLPADMDLGPPPSLDFGLTMEDLGGPVGGPDLTMEDLGGPVGGPGLTMEDLGGPVGGPVEVDLNPAPPLTRAPSQVTYDDISEEAFNLPDQQSLEELLVTPQPPPPQETVPSSPPPPAEEAPAELPSEVEEKEVEEEPVQEALDLESFQVESDFLCRDWELFVVGDKPLINPDSGELTPKSFPSTPSSNPPMEFGEYVFPPEFASLRAARSKGGDTWFGESNKRSFEHGETRYRSLHLQLTELRERTKETVGEEFYEKLEKELGEAWRVDEEAEKKKREEEERKKEEEERKKKEEERKKKEEEERKKKEEEERKKKEEEEKKKEEERKKKEEEERKKKEEEERKKEEEKRKQAQSPSQSPDSSERIFASSLDKLKSDLREFVGLLRTYSTSQDLKAYINFCESFKANVTKLNAVLQKHSPELSKTLQEYLVAFWKNAMNLAHATNKHVKAGLPPAGKEAEVAELKGSVMNFVKFAKSAAELKIASPVASSPSSSPSSSPCASPSIAPPPTLTNTSSAPLPNSPLSQAAPSFPRSSSPSPSSSIQFSRSPPSSPQHPRSPSPSQSFHGSPRSSSPQLSPSQTFSYPQQNNSQYLGVGGTQSQYASGTGSQYASGTGSQYSPGTGSQYASGTGSQYTPGTGSQYASGTGSQYASGTGSQYASETGSQYTPGTGSQYASGTGSQSPGTGRYASGTGSQYASGTGSQYSAYQAAGGSQGGLTQTAMNAVDQTILSLDTNPGQVQAEIRQITAAVKQISSAGMVPPDLKQPMFVSLKGLIEKQTQFLAQPHSKLAKMHLISQLKNLKSLLFRCQ